MVPPDSCHQEARR